MRRAPRRRVQNFGCGRLFLELSKIVYVPPPLQPAWNYDYCSRYGCSLLLPPLARRERGSGLGAAVHESTMGFLILVLLVGGGFGIRFLYREYEASQARQAEEAARQLGYQRQILAACDESITAFENIPKDLMNADQLLGTAEAEFRTAPSRPFGTL